MENNFHWKKRKIRILVSFPEKQILKYNLPQSSGRRATNSHSELRNFTNFGCMFEKPKKKYLPSIRNDRGKTIRSNNSGNLSVEVRNFHFPGFMNDASFRKSGLEAVVVTPGPEGPILKENQGVGPPTSHLLDSGREDQVGFVSGVDVLSTFSKEAEVVPSPNIEGTRFGQHEGNSGPGMNTCNILKRKVLGDMCVRDILWNSKTTAAVGPPRVHTSVPGENNHVGKTGSEVNNGRIKSLEESRRVRLGIRRESQLAFIVLSPGPQLPSIGEGVTGIRVDVHGNYFFRCRDIH
jgi:hypothetical protein